MKYNKVVRRVLNILQKPQFVLIALCATLLTACTTDNAQTNSQQQNRQKAVPQSSAETSNTQQPTATATPFQEITIPYLKNVEYKSNFSELQRVSDSTNFTSYVTSYTSEGLKINALLTQPKGQKPANGWPAIVFVHGYIPPTLYRTQEKYVEYINYLARNGFVVLKIDLRGHGSSEGEATGSYYSGDYVIDTLNAHAALQSADFVDPDNIGLWGHSMAGNVTLRSTAVKQTIPATVIWGGAGFTYSDLREYRISDNSYRPPTDQSQLQRRRQALFDAHGDFNPADPFWKQVPATNYLDGVKTAIQLHHAVNDDVVNVEYSRNLKKVLDNTPIEHELYEYSSGGHNINGSSFTQAMQRTVEFYKRHLSN